MVHDTESGDSDDDGKLWLNGLAFGEMAKILNNKVKKGSKLLIGGTLKVKEYVSQKTGKAGEDKTVFLETVKVAGLPGTIDEFTEYTDEGTPF